MSRLICGVRRVIMTIKERIAAREPLCGCHVNLADLAVTEIMAGMGYDMVWVDMEHTTLSTEQVHGHLAAAAAAGTPVMVRVPVNDLTNTKRVLEMGPDAIVFPMVCDSEHAKELMSWTLYPPYGNRGCGPRRAVHYGMDSESHYYGEGHLKLCRFVQIETKTAAEDAEAIAAIPYLDGCILGMHDLSGSIGRLGDVFCEENVELAEMAIKAFIKHGKTVGVATYATDKETLTRYRDMGVNLIFSGADYEYIRIGALNTLGTLKELQRGG